MYPRGSRLGSRVEVLVMPFNCSRAVQHCTLANEQPKYEAKDHQVPITKCLPQLTTIAGFCFAREAFCMHVPQFDDISQSYKLVGEVLIMMINFNCISGSLKATQQGGKD